MVFHPRKGGPIQSEEPPFSGGYAVFEGASVVQCTVIVHPDPKSMTVAFCIGKVVVDFKHARRVGFARIE